MTRNVEKDVRRRCVHLRVEPVTDDPYWRFRCVVCGLKYRVIPPADRL